MLWAVRSKKNKTKLMEHGFDRALEAISEVYWEDGDRGIYVDDLDKAPKKVAAFFREKAKRMQ